MDSSERPPLVIYSRNWAFISKICDMVVRRGEVYFCLLNPLFLYDKDKCVTTWEQNEISMEGKSFD